MRKRGSGSRSVIWEANLTRSVGGLTRLLALLVAFALLAGCGGDDPAPAQAPATGAVDFTWQGTIAGRDDHLHLAPDGSSTLRSGGNPEQALDIPQAVVDNVMQDLAAADLAGLAPKYPGLDVSDGQVQTVSAGGHTVQSE